MQGAESVEREAPQRGQQPGACRPAPSPAADSTNEIGALVRDDRLRYAAAAAAAAAAANRLCPRPLPAPPNSVALQEFGQGVLPQLVIDEVVYNIDMAQSFRCGGQGVVYLCR